MADNIIQFPNSPGIDITVTRGGTDPITGEPLSDQFVNFSWDTEYVEDGETKTRTETHGFLGPNQ